MLFPGTAPRRRRCTGQQALRAFLVGSAPLLSALRHMWEPDIQHYLAGLAGAFPAAWLLQGVAQPSRSLSSPGDSWRNRLSLQALGLLPSLAQPQISLPAPEPTPTHRSPSGAAAHRLDSRTSPGPGGIPCPVTLSCGLPTSAGHRFRGTSVSSGCGERIWSTHASPATGWAHSRHH